MEQSTLKTTTLEKSERAMVFSEIVIKRALVVVVGNVEGGD
jgi:hypothetical protein